MIKFIVILFVLISFPSLASETCPDGVYKYDSELDKTVCSAPFDPDAPKKCPGYVLHEGKTVCKTSIIEKEVVEEDVCIITHETDEAIYWTGKVKAGICAKPCDPCEKMEYSEELKEKIKKEEEQVIVEDLPDVTVTKEYQMSNFVDRIVVEEKEIEYVEEETSKEEILQELEILLEESEVIIVREVPIKLPIPVEEEKTKDEILQELDTLLEEPEVILVEEVPIKLPIPVVESTVECLPSGDCYDPDWKPTYEEKQEVIKEVVEDTTSVSVHDNMPVIPVKEITEVIVEEKETCVITEEDEKTIWWKDVNSVGYCTKPCDPCQKGEAVVENEVTEEDEEEIANALEDAIESEMNIALLEMGWYEEEDIKVKNFDLEQQLLRVIRNHPRVLAALKDVEVSKEAIKIANSSRKPQASITTNNGIEEVENPQSDDVNRYYDDQTLTITQLLSDFGRSKAATDKAISDKMITDLAYKQTVQSVVSEGLTAYYGLIKAYNTFKTNSAIMAGLKEQQKQMQAKLDVGKATKDQYNAIKSQVVAQQSLLISLQYAYDMAQNRFSAVFGNLPADISSMKMAKIDSSITIPDTEKMAVYWSSKGSISINISKQTLESSKLQAKVDKKQWAPTITLKMEGITTSTGGTSGIKVDKSFYVTMSVPLYTGGMNSAMKRQSMEAVEASLLRLDDTRITVKESIQNAFAGYKVAEANIKVLLIQYQMAKEALDNAQKQVEAGKMPIDSLTPLKNNLLNMQTSLKNASADLELAKMSLFLALGWLEITQDGEPTQNSIKITTDSK